MRIVVAPQSLKGSLTAAETGMAIAQGARAVYPEAEIVIVPVADGGEGTVQALVDATGGRIVEQVVTGPLGEPVTAFFGILGDDRTAAIEMAACAGLPLVSPSRRDPRITTTYGVGELILAALEMGSRNFIIGIGGSATNDGGAGMAQALGASLVDAQGQQIERGGAALAVLEHISIDGMDPRLQDCSFDVACDVTNPLCGPMGASAVYGPQKGATPEMVVQLDAALARYAGVIERDLGLSVRDIPGAGAAGGLGAGLLAFVHATLRPGAHIVLEAVRLEEQLQRRRPGHHRRRPDRLADRLWKEHRSRRRTGETLQHPCPGSGGRLGRALPGGLRSGSRCSCRAALTPNDARIRHGARGRIDQRRG